MKRYCLALDLKDDMALIADYEAYHRAVWPEILQSIREAGIDQMEIYRTGNRLFMIMEVNEDFSFEKKAGADAANDKVQQWEQLMWKYQQGLPGAKPGEKWILMEKSFTCPGLQTGDDEKFITCPGLQTGDDGKFINCPGLQAGDDEKFITCPGLQPGDDEKFITCPGLQTGDDGKFITCPGLQARVIK